MSKQDCVDPISLPLHIAPGLVTHQGEHNADQPFTMAAFASRTSPVPAHSGAPISTVAATSPDVKQLALGCETNSRASPPYRCTPTRSDYLMVTSESSADFGTSRRVMDTTQLTRGKQPKSTLTSEKSTCHTHARKCTPIRTPQSDSFSPILLYGNMTSIADMSLSPTATDAACLSAMDVPPLDAMPSSTTTLSTSAVGTPEPAVVGAPHTAERRPNYGHRRIISLDGMSTQMNAPHMSSDCTSSPREQERAAPLISMATSAVDGEDDQPGFLCRVLDTPSCEKQGRSGGDAAQRACLKHVSMSGTGTRGGGGESSAGPDEVNGTTQSGWLRGSLRGASRSGLLHELRRPSVVVVDPMDDAFTPQRTDCMYEAEQVPSPVRRRLEKSLSLSLPSGVVGGYPRRSRSRSQCGEGSVDASPLASCEGRRPLSCVVVSMVVCHGGSGSASDLGGSELGASKSTRSASVVSRRSHEGAVRTMSPDTRWMMRLCRSLLPPELAEDPDKPTFLVGSLSQWIDEGRKTSFRSRTRSSNALPSFRSVSLHDTDDVPLNTLHDMDRSCLFEADHTLTSMTVSEDDSSPPLEQFVEVEGVRTEGPPNAARAAVAESSAASRSILVSVHAPTMPKSAPPPHRKLSLRYKRAGAAYEVTSEAAQRSRTELPPARFVDTRLWIPRLDSMDTTANTSTAMSTTEPQPLGAVRGRHSLTADAPGTSAAVRTAADTLDATAEARGSTFPSFFCLARPPLPRTHLSAPGNPRPSQSTRSLLIHNLVPSRHASPTSPLLSASCQGLPYLSSSTTQTHTHGLSAYSETTYPPRERRASSRDTTFSAHFDSPATHLPPHPRFRAVYEEALNKATLHSVQGVNYTYPSS